MFSEKDDSMVENTDYRTGQLMKLKLCHEQMPPWNEATCTTISSRSSLPLPCLGRLLCQTWQPLVMLLWYATSAVICTWKMDALPFVPNKSVCIWFKMHQWIWMHLASVDLNVKAKSHLECWLEGIEENFYFSSLCSTRRQPKSISEFWKTQSTLSFIPTQVF